MHAKRTARYHFHYQGLSSVVLMCVPTWPCLVFVLDSVSTVVLVVFVWSFICFTLEMAFLLSDTVPILLWAHKRRECSDSREPTRLWPLGTRYK